MIKTLQELKSMTNNLTNFSNVNLLKIASPILINYLPQHQKNELFMAKANQVHGNKYDYSQVVYNGWNTKVKIICPIHGVFYQTPNSHLIGQGCPKCAPNKIGDHFRKTTEQFIKEANKVHNNKYNYSLTKYVNNKTKVIIICPEHGTFKQTPSTHVNGKQGCRQCGLTSLRKSTERFIKEATQIHGNKYDYSKVVYNNWNTKIQIICPRHGSFCQTPNIHLFGSGCPKCSSSKGESQIRSILLSNNIQFIEQYNFNKHQHLRNKSSYMAFDFYLPDYNLCIEYDGEQHFGIITHGRFKTTIEDLNKIQHRDSLKNLFCLNNNIRLLRVPYWINITEQLILFHLNENFTTINSLR